MKPVILAVATVLFTAAASLALGPDWVERRVGALGVMLPAGADWEVSQDETNGGWGAFRVGQTWSGAPRYLHSIQIVEHQCPAIFSDWLPVEVATDYLLWEIENMEVEGIDKQVFSLPELDVYQEARGDFTLHVLRNVKDYIEPWHPDLRLEAQELYLVFLADFAETTTFYKVFISADCFFEGCTVDDLDLSEMTPLLDDLRDYSGGAN